MDRIKALEMAAQFHAGTGSPADVVATATTFHNFLSADEAQPAADGTEPKRGRGRPPKVAAQTETAATATAPASPSQPIVETPASAIPSATTAAAPAAAPAIAAPVVAAPQVAAAPTAAASTPAPAVASTTKEDVSKALIALIKANKRAAVEQILKANGNAGSVTDLKPYTYTAVVAQATAALAA